MKFTPVPRTADIIVQDINDEVLLYDISVQKAYALNETTAIVWRNLDGKNSIDDVALKSGLPKQMVMFAVEELQKQNLLDGKIETGLPKDKLSRRKALLAMGASAIALPVITTMVAPLAIHAQSICMLSAPGTVLSTTAFGAPGCFGACTTTPGATCSSTFVSAATCCSMAVTASCPGTTCTCACA